MKNKRPHFGRVFAVSFLLYILYFGIIDTIDTSIDNKLFLVLISPAFLVLGILIFYAFYSDTARYMLFFFITIAMLYLSIIFTLVVGVLIYFSFFYKSEKIRKIAKIGLFISGFFAIPLIVSFFGYEGLYKIYALFDVYSQSSNFTDFLSKYDGDELLGEIYKIIDERIKTRELEGKYSRDIISILDEYYRNMIGYTKELSRIKKIDENKILKYE